MPTFHVPIRKSKTRRPTRTGKMTLDQQRLTRAEIAAALKRRPNWLMRLRLIAVEMALSGRPLDEAAASANVQIPTLKAWLGLITRAGILRALEKWEGHGRPRKLDADAMALREEARKQQNPRIRKRILALACIADGMSVDDTSAQVGINHSVIYTWIRRFQTEGIAPLLVLPKGRPRG